VEGEGSPPLGPSPAVWVGTCAGTQGALSYVLPQYNTDDGDGGRLDVVERMGTVSGAGNEEQSLGFERVVFFGDAVFAIVITLLVLPLTAELEVPGEGVDLIHEIFSGQGPGMLTFGLPRRGAVLDRSSPDVRAPAPGGPWPAVVQLG